MEFDRLGFEKKTTKNSDNVTTCRPVTVQLSLSIDTVRDYNEIIYVSNVADRNFVT